MSKNNTDIAYFKVYVSDVKKDKGEPVISGNQINTVVEATSWDNGFTIQKGKKGKHVTIELAANPTVTDGLILDEIRWIFGD